MDDAKRFKLHYGPYGTPRFRFGQRVWDEVRGQVTIVGLSDGRIPWPIGKTKRAKSLVVFRGLAQAVRREASLAVRHWWGVGPSTVRNWRRALDVPPLNEGNRLLQRAQSREPWFREMQKKAWAKAQDPVRCAKIAAAKRGQSRPPHVREKLRQANLGRKATAETRQKMSLSHKRLGTRPPKAGRPWRPEEYSLLRQHPPAEVARLTGRTLQAVYRRRRMLGIRRRKNRSPRNG